MKSRDLRAILASTAVAMGVVAGASEPARAVEEATVEMLEGLVEGATIDCNSNGLDDDIDMARGTSVDSNGNGVLDECEPVAGDLDANDTVDAADGLVLTAAYGAVEGIDPNFVYAADMNDDHRIDQQDVSLWARRFVSVNQTPLSCADGRDNDRDGAIDFPSDPDCRSVMAREEGMGSASDTTVAPGEARLTPEMERLEAALLERAGALLERFGTTFYGLAMYETTEGKLREAVPMEPAPLEPARVAESLRKALRVGEALRATAVGVALDLPEELAVRVELEDRGGRCLRVRRVYGFDESGRVSFGTSLAAACERRILSGRPR